MYAYSYLEYQDQVIDSVVEKKMCDIQGRALQKISSFITHFSTDFATLLAYSYFDSLPSAIKIADALNLCKLDFLAIQENFKEFKEEYLNEMEYEGYYVEV